MGLCCNREAKKEPKYPSKYVKKQQKKLINFLKLFRKFKKKAGEKERFIYQKKNLKNFLNTWKFMKFNHIF